MDVADDELINDSVEFWLDDSVEVFIDADNSKSETYGENDYQYNFSWDSSAPTMGETKHNKTEGVQYAFDRDRRRLSPGGQAALVDAGDHAERRHARSGSTST